MSPLNHNLDTTNTENGEQLGAPVSDMRRVSLALANNPAREARRSKMEAASWIGSKLGIHLRRALRS